MSPNPTAPEARIEVRKTYKLYIGGAFPRSESGRTYEVHASDRRGTFLANAAMGSRKDARDAVVAARGAFGGWSTATAYNRGQVLYRVAELMEGRRAQFVAEVAAAEGVPARRAETLVSQAIDRWVWYAGWSDKIAQVLGGLNPVAGPYFDITAPEPTGVVAVLAPDEPCLLALVSLIAPAILSGNTVVAVASEKYPLPAVTFSEILATSDLPGGVVNLLTGRRADLLDHFASHMDINAIVDGTGSGECGKRLQAGVAVNLKRYNDYSLAATDWATARAEDPYRILGTVEFKTAWHPIGL
jgi:acyl-CoA reductase-like NAD-dependent aldehyde dehydrogenase